LTRIEEILTSKSNKSNIFRTTPSFPLPFSTAGIGKTQALIVNGGRGLLFSDIVYYTLNTKTE
jgi:3-mercaptopyruvate sulfurtransferase SseA